MSITDKKIWRDLSRIAWKSYENAYILSNTKVGASLISETNTIYSGCNIQQSLRSHDIHAEVNAIGNMVNNGDREIHKLLIAADKKLFTPCGSCMDWIMQFSCSSTIIGFQNCKNGEYLFYSPKVLMPHYPIK